MVTKMTGVVTILALCSFLLLGCGQASTVTPVALLETPALPTPTPIPTVAPTARAQAPTKVAPTALPTPTKIEYTGSVEFILPDRAIVGQSAQVVIVAREVEGIYGAQFTLRYDPDLVSVEDEYADLDGDQIRVGTAFPEGQSFIAMNRIDAQQGTIDFAATLLNPAEPLDGDVELAAFAFVPLAEGVAEYSWDELLLVDRAGLAQSVRDDAALLAIDAQ